MMSAAISMKAMVTGTYLPPQTVVVNGHTHPPFAETLQGELSVTTSMKPDRSQKETADINDFSGKRGEEDLTGHRLFQEHPLLKSSAAMADQTSKIQQASPKKIMPANAGDSTKTALAQVDDEMAEARDKIETPATKESKKMGLADTDVSGSDEQIASHGPQEISGDHDSVEKIDRAKDAMPVLQGKLSADERKQKKDHVEGGGASHAAMQVEEKNLAHVETDASAVAEKDAQGALVPGVAIVGLQAPGQQVSVKEVEIPAYGRDVNEGAVGNGHRRSIASAGSNDMRRAGTGKQDADESNSSRADLQESSTTVSLVSDSGRDSKANTVGASESGAAQISEAGTVAGLHIVEGLTAGGHAGAIDVGGKLHAGSTEQHDNASATFRMQMLEGNMSDMSVAEGSPRMLSASPTALEVGMQDGMHGWLKVRAEVTETGTVNATLSSSSTVGQELLHREMPSLTAYLAEEKIGINAVVVHGMERGMQQPSGSAEGYRQPSAQQGPGQGGEDRSHGRAHRSDDALPQNKRVAETSTVVPLYGEGGLSVRA